MKRSILLAGAATLAFLIPAVAQGQPPTAQHIKQYERLYAQARHQLGHRAPGRNIVRDGLSTGQQPSDEDVRRSISVLERMVATQRAPSLLVVPEPAAAPPAPATTTTAYTSTGGYGSVPGVPSSFAACVAMRESTDGAGSSNIYGILPSNGYTPGMSIAAQKALFSQMYGAQGAAPWAPYDGC